MTEKNICMGKHCLKLFFALQKGGGVQHTDILSRVVWCHGNYTTLAQFFQSFNVSYDTFDNVSLTDGH